MDIKTLDERVSATGQVNPADLAKLKDAGFSVVVNNRPDGEEAGQPQTQDLADAAKQLGLDYYYIPVVPMEGLTRTALLQFGEILDSSDGKILAFCRSGARSSALWQHATK